MLPVHSPCWIEGWSAGWLVQMNLSICIIMNSHSFFLLPAETFYFALCNVQEIYLFANEGENHTNNVKQLEEMKKGTEDTDRTFGSEIRRNFLRARPQNTLEFTTPYKSGKSGGPL